jgi:NADH-quinone oxidoreductase subunit L
MGGLKRDLPITYWTFLIGALAIAGVPGLAGFFSKDEILANAFLRGHVVLWTVGMITSFLTALYMFRLVFMAFHGTRRADHHGPAVTDEQPEVESPQAHHGVHLHDAPPAMAIPLIVLAIGSIAAGYVGVPHILGGASRFEHFLAPSFQAPLMAQMAAEAASETGLIENPGLELILMGLASLMALGGIALAARIYLQRPETAERLAARFPRVYRFLLNKGYVDEIYNETIVQPIKALSEGALWQGLDATVIDGAVNGTGTIVAETGSLVRRAQTGSVRAYAMSVLLGAVVVLGYYLWR